MVFRQTLILQLGSQIIGGQQDFSLFSFAAYPIGADAAVPPYQHKIVVLDIHQCLTLLPQSQGSKDDASLLVGLPQVRSNIVVLEVLLTEGKI